MQKIIFGRIAALVLAAIPFILRAQPLAEADGKFLGNIIGDPWGIQADFDDYWNQVTPENHGKWGSVEAVRDRMDWAGLDIIYQYAKDRGQLALRIPARRFSGGPYRLRDPKNDACPLKNANPRRRIVPARAPCANPRPD